RSCPRAAAVGGRERRRHARRQTDHHLDRALRRRPGGTDGGVLSGVVTMSTTTTFAPSAVKTIVSAEVLDKIDIRVGTIERVEDVANSNKLVKLTVNFGDHTRSILAGMKKERVDPKAEIEGRQALFVVNLAPKKMAGEASEGMLFDIGYADGLVPVLAVP